jgi:hypothetical protein
LNFEGRLVIRERDMEMTDMEKVQILLAEYNTLKAQIISRGATSVQVIAIGVAALAVSASLLKDNLRLGLVVFLSLLIGVGVQARLTNRDLLEEAAQVRRLEAEINSRAREKLLTWETSNGRAQTGWLHGFWGSTPDKNKTETLPRSH